ncbi:hypothetical protein CRG98_035697 [Punica granatum]|uniref:Uncharacterized protein n=1 Tax=Punica granatum TaxID=22663 RepID=A0A2I0IJD4_PUNGR|nr:hypothetical protein CRG98_035697 [Punica granatum]
MASATHVLERKLKRKEGSRPPIGNLDPSTKVVGILHGYRQPQLRGWSCQPTTPAPPQRPPVPTEDAGNLGGGTDVADWQLQPSNQSGTLTRSPRSIRGLGQPIGLDPSFPF